MTLKVERAIPGFENWYHFHAAPKYRSSIFSPPVATRLQELLREKCRELEWPLRAVAVDTDHVHFLIQSGESPSYIAQRIFGFLSYQLRRDFPELKDLNAEQLWGGRQCKPIVDHEHMENTIAYIERHRRSE
jgi:putative transposase